MSDSLSTKKCVACEGDAKPLTKAQAELFLKQIPEWQLRGDNKAITRDFKFKGHLALMNFLNAVAYLSQRENHHPDVVYSYNTCTIAYITHAIDGLSENDFICAAKVNQLTDEK